MSQLQKGALKFVLFLIPMVCLSNLLSTTVAYCIGGGILSTGIAIAATQPTASDLMPLWSLALSKLISNDQALLLGGVLGIGFSLQFPKKAQVVSKVLLKGAFFFLNTLFLPLMPLFIAGFALKLQHDQLLPLICENYLLIFLMIVVLQFSYILFIYGAVNAFRFSAWVASIRNMLPAMITGFSTMSSAAAMPITLIASEKNTGNSEIARGVVPATVNIHLVGDCFAIPLLAMGILLSFGEDIPDVYHYGIFAIYFILAKFAVAAVPGGGVLVMLPVLEQHLGFSSIMLSLVTALYILFDPLINSANVMGNGAFAMVFSKIYAKKWLSWARQES
jgi:Na+/H+-dicarboxylate symporter